MPRTKSDLTPAEYAVLGLLREQPSYGYQLRGHLAPEASLGRVCPVEPAMVYAILRSLTGLDLIDGAWDDSGYPPKAIYTVTDAGSAIFERWLRRPAARLREVRQEFLIKLYFALREDPGLALELLGAQAVAIEAYADELEREREARPAAAGDFDAFVIDSKVAAARATLEWLETCRQQVAGGRRRPPATARASRRR